MKDLPSRQLDELKTFIFAYVVLAPLLSALFADKIDNIFVVCILFVGLVGTAFIHLKNRLGRLEESLKEQECRLMELEDEWRRAWTWLRISWSRSGAISINETEMRLVMQKDGQERTLQDLSTIFITCFLASYAFLLFWFFFYLVSGEWGYKFTSGWFKLSRHDYDLMSYFGMAYVKLCAILFFLFPYLSIRLLLRRKKIKR